jgi:NADH dehydrogenase
MVNTPIVGAEPGIVKLKDGSALETGTFIWTAGVTGCAFADSLELAKGPFGRSTESAPGEPPRRNRKGRLLVTEEMRSVDYPNVFPVGDNLWFVEDGKPLPQIVETAIQTGETAAHNIISDIEGREKKKFKSNFHGFMVSVGGKYAVSNAMGIKLSGIFAMAVKHLVNLHYLISVAGINQCWEYIKHEFLNMQNGRSFVRGFGSYRTRGYWILPVRLWLGLMWVFEGINKIGEGWLKWGEGSKSSWMFSSGVIQKGAEAVTAVEDLFGSPIDDLFGSVDDLFGAFDPGIVADAVSSATWGETDTVFEGVWNLAKPIFDFNGPVSTWFRTTFMDNLVALLPFQGFQLLVVLTEIAIGCAIAGGLFTWLAAAVSIVMCIVFTLSGMFAWNQVWFIFGGFLLLGGAGRAFGLDCWVIPALKKWWNGTVFARKHYFYLDGPSK